MMCKTKIISIFAFVLLVLLGLNVSAAVIPITVDSVEVDGTVITVNDTTRVDLERGNRVEIRVDMTASANASDVVVEAFISGYEYGDREAISDATHVFDVEGGVRYVKKLSLNLPDRADEDDYKIRVIVSDRYSDEIVYNYNIKLDVPRHSLTIKDVVFSPEGRVVAGRALLTAVRIKNMGEQDEDGIKIKVEIPELGLSAADYVEELDYDDSITSEELYLRIPTCTEAGDYNVKVSVYYDENYESASVMKSIYVESDETCSGAAAQDGRVVISVSTEPQDVVSGTTGAVYPLVVTNQGSSSKTLAVGLEGVADWADTRISPSNVVIVGAGESKTVYVYVAAKDNAVAGDYTFVLNVQSDSKTEQIPLKATVVGGKATGWDSIKSGLEIGLVILVVLLIILGLIIGFSKLRSSGDDDDQGQTYY